MTRRCRESRLPLGVALPPYYAGKAHQAERIGDLYYRYDLNGNMIEEREGGHGTSAVTAGTITTTGDVRSTDTGFGIVRTTGTSTSATKTIYARYYAWDEENRLIRSVDNNIAVDYLSRSVSFCRFGGADDFLDSTMR